MTKNNKQLWLIPYAHLDTQWRWEYPTTIKKYIKNTLDENIYLFDKFPEYVFNFTGAIRYAMMKEYYPEKFEKIKPYIKQGRWNLAGTCLDETDTLSPCVESMIRNILYGDRWAREEFGISSRDYMIPDCFGFPANMPSVLAHCGLHGFSTQKLTWGSAVGIPFEIGIWEGPDGNGIVSALNPGGYNWRVFPPLHLNPWKIKKLNKLGEKTGIWKSFQYFGVGDIGGAPTEGSVKRALSSMDHAEGIDPDLEIKLGSSDEFFSEITTEERNKMDNYKGDLLLINHSAGSLTSAAAMKRWNRKNEQMAFAAEGAAITALWKAGLQYPTQKIKSAWFRTIGNQMHDILPGTSTPIAYEYSHNDEVVALLTWTSILEDSAKAVAPFVKGKGKILVFNPLGEKRKDPVDFKLIDWKEQGFDNPVIVGADGEILPMQIRKTDAKKYIGTFNPELKPFGWSRFEIQEAKDVKGSSAEGMNTKNGVTLNIVEDNYILENSKYRVTIDKKGKIESIYQKSIEKELLKKPLAYEFQSERPRLFPAWNMDWSDRKKDPYLRIEGNGEVSILEEGPIRCTIQITTDLNESKLVKEVSLSQDSDIVEFIERIHWRELGCSLRLAINANMQEPDANFNWETARIERPVNHEKLFEMPSRYWVDLRENEWGISLINDSKNAYDRPRPDTLRLTMLYTPAVRLFMGFKDQKWQDWGEHTIKYAIYGHKGSYEGTDHFARLFNLPTRTFEIIKDKTSESKSDVSLLEIANERVGILALKKAEDNDGLVLRLYERCGKGAESDVKFNTEILEAHAINGLEEVIDDTDFNGKILKVKIEPNSISSYLINLKGIKDIKKSEDNPYEPLKLDSNRKMFGGNSDDTGLFPAEMVPEVINAGTIAYHLDVNNEYNALQCNKQKISLPHNSNTLSILVGADDALETEIKWLEDGGGILKTQSIHVPKMTGYRGQWDKRIWKWQPKRHLKNKRDYVWLNKCVGIEPGYVKRDRIEWYSNHTHRNGEDQPYQYGYMYTIDLDIPDGTRSLELPDERRVNIFAMTASQQDIKLEGSQYLVDKYDF
ncbi:MAG: hypothetical protein GF364_12680 [Candidatus Lokiarchaeota archaeon]|nr:hypothetical protein [Candidatus Lokiarchaeota archaeon]